MPPLTAGLWRNFRAYQVYGANTDVGKTIVSTLLCRAARSHGQGKVWYLKPVSTGAADDADVGHVGKHARGVHVQNLYQFADPVSPHLAATQAISDDSLVSQVAASIRANAGAGSGLMLVETAGGPLSPGPSGTPQADLYRPLRLPSVFVADHRLGGISTSVSAAESLAMRGYDVAGVAIMQGDVYRNHEYLREYFGERGVPVLVVPPPPERGGSNDDAAMGSYYQTVEAAEELAEFHKTLLDRHHQRVDELEQMPARAMDRIWWPFAQHTTLSQQTITAIDSAHGDYFQTHRTPSAPSDTDVSLIQPSVDGSASWWTQGLGHANPALTMAAARAAGRYGHVMFGESIHEPAMQLADKLVAAVGSDADTSLERVFYSDNGSTGMEVAVKMALTATCVQRGWDTAAAQDLEIVGLANSYHGDTIGAMDLSEPGVYNRKIAWYRGRGAWFACPGVSMRQGRWVVERPPAVQEACGLAATADFASLEAIFDTRRDDSDEARAYAKYFEETLEYLSFSEGRRFGALVMEPVVLGAGGMILADPLYQRTLARVVCGPRVVATAAAAAAAAAAPAAPADDHAWTSLPLVADEVFTGLYRLGHATSSALLHLRPDVSVHAKLLTGGLVPLAATLATDAVFRAFLSTDKADALLHGHSYTAHPVGCSVAVASLDLLAARAAGPHWDAFRADWARAAPAPQGVVAQVGAAVSAAVGAAVGAAAPTRTPTTARPLWSVWSHAFVAALSRDAARVHCAWALGSVLAVTLRDAAGGGGYTSDAARALQRRLLVGAADASGEGAWAIHSRVLGNVLYLMASQMSGEDEVRRWEARVTAALESL